MSIKNREFSSNISPSFDNKDENFQQEMKEINIPKPKLCLHHFKPFSFFCSSCKEPICQQCSLLGPHNSQLHQIITLNQAYSSISHQLSSLIKDELLKKKELLIAQIYRIEHRVEEIKIIKKKIQMDVREEYSQILENLKYNKSEKIAILDKEVSDLQENLDTLNDIGINFIEITSNNADPLYFMLNSRKIYENLQYLISKPFKNIIDIYPNDLPRDLTEKRIELEKNQAFKEIINFKDNLILKLKAVMEDKIKNRKDNIEKQALDMINLVTNINNQLANQLKKFNMVCYYCGAPFSTKTINKKCEKNAKIPPKDFIGFTKKPPYPKYHGLLQHFFGFPNEMIMKNVKSLFSFEENLEKTEKKTLENEKKNLRTFIEIQVAKIRKIIIEKKIDLEEIFESHDENSSEKINYIQFSYILNEMCEVEPADIDQLINIFDSEGTKLIAYPLFLMIINNPQNIDQVLTNYFKNV